MVVAPVWADSSPAAPDIGTSKPEDLFKIFARAEPLQSGQYEIEELAKIFPDFQHQPYDRAGFDAVMLPFVYSDRDHVGDANEALALDALMSYDLDWSPGSYCTRHAFYVFEHDRIEIQAMLKGYAPAHISSLIKSWRATHAIGGELIRTAAGYEGKLQIFAADGKQIFARRYDQPRSFWDLLGDMDVDAMTFLDVKPSEELVAHLHQPRCRLPQSLIDLGSTAFTAERSPVAFDAYEKILKADPMFAMVRTWYASQKWVHDRDTRSEAAQLGIALSSRLEPAALWGFIPRYCPDRDLASQYGYWLNDAAELVSEDSPLVISCRLGKGYYGSQNLQAIVDRGLKAAAKYPNSHNLVWGVAANADDSWMSASLLTSCLLDRYWPSFSDQDKASLKLSLAVCCGRTGRDDLAMELLSGEDPQQSKIYLYQLLESLSRGGQYAQAADYYQLLGPPFNPTASKWMAPYAAFAAVVTDKPQLLDQILKDQHDVLALENLDDVFQGYRDAMDGKTLDPKRFLGSGRTVSSQVIWNTLLIAYCDAKQGTSRYHHLMTECLYGAPVNRLVWIAQDDYQRRDPSNDAAAFYEYLGWLFGDDPWVAKAVADFHRRGGAERRIDPLTLRVDLARGLRDGPYYLHPGKLDWDHVLTPWRVAACVHQLLKQNNIDHAARIASEYKNFESLGTTNGSRRSVACELLHRASRWKNPS
jgi:tetratricopeptide (TPR) repeat protein